MARTAVEWTQATWNPVTGCDKVSPGCKHCYAEVMARRLEAMGQPNYRNGFRVTLQPHMLERPLSWRRPQMIFVNSMSDLFHKDVPLTFVERAFATISRAHWHTFQVLTKRAERLEELAPALPWPANLWMGVSVEREDYAYRIEHLRRVPARVRFLSLEPLLGPLGGLDLSGIGWVIVGGESGHGARRRTQHGCWRSRRSAGVPACRRAVLLQAVGRTEQEAGRTPLEGPHVGWHAYDRRSAGMTAGPFSPHRRTHPAD